MRCIAWARLLGSLSKKYTIWSKMAMGKGPKPPLFKSQHSIVWKTYFKYQPSKGEGTKNAKTKLYILMYKLDNNTYQRGRGKREEVGKNRQRRIKTESVFTQWKCEKNDQQSILASISYGLNSLEGVCKKCTILTHLIRPGCCNANFLFSVTHMYRKIY